MQKTLYSAAALTPALLILGGLQPSASAYNNPTTRNLSAEQLYAQLQSAVCQNDWDGAINALEPLIGVPGITPAYRENLVRFREQLQDWRAAGSFFPEFSGCGSQSFTREIVFDSTRPGFAQSRVADVRTTGGRGTSAQDATVQQHYANLQRAVCQNDWDGAIATINPMIGSPSIGSSYRQQLVSFRAQLQDWRAGNATFNSSSCSGAIATASTPEQIHSVDWAG